MRHADETNRLTLAADTGAALPTSRLLTRRGVIRGAGVALAAGATGAIPARFPAAQDAVGPVSGELRYDNNADTGRIGSRSFNLDSANVLINATFRNPDNADRTLWSYGFEFRRVGRRGAAIYLSRGGYWDKREYDDRGETIAEQARSGSVFGLRGGANETNDMQVIATGDVAELLVNGATVAALRVGDVSSGDVRVVAGFISERPSTEGTVRYERFQVAPPPGPPSAFAERARGYLYGPANGGIALVQGDFVDRVTTNLQMQNGVINARFFVPYNDPDVRWDCGYQFRASNTVETRVYVNSVREYVAYHYTREDPDAEWDSRFLQSGTAAPVRVREGEFNDIELRVQDTVGTLAVNGAEVGRIPLPDSPAGFVRVGSAFGRGNKKPDTTVRYENFTVMPLPVR